MLEILAGIISLLVAGAFLGILLYAVPSAPLWIVVLFCFGLMIASLYESLREESR